MAMHRILVFAGLLSLLSTCVWSEPFPEVDRSKLLISLQRTACFGSCPDYNVTIDGRGFVLFTTKPSLIDPVSAVHREYSRVSGVRVAGAHRARIDPSVVTNLVAKFKEANFFNLKSQYRAEVTDNPTYILSIDTGNGRKVVVDYVGRKAGMPEAVTRLQDAVDIAAGTDRWIEGTAKVIPLLQSEGADFSGPLGLELMDAAAMRGEISMMDELKGLGAPILLKQGPNPLISAIHEQQHRAMRWLLERGAAKSAATFQDAIRAAVSSDNHEAFAALSSLRGAPKIDAALATELLASAASNGDLELVGKLLGLGAMPNGAAKDVSNFSYDPPLFLAANGVSANSEKHGITERRSVVSKLLMAGASPTRCIKEYCDSSLWLVSDPVVATLLVDAGADPNFRDDEGEHILFSIYEEQVALVLIAHGANLKAVRPADRMTLRGWAKYQKWPRVLTILDRARL